MIKDLFEVMTYPINEPTSAVDLNKIHASI